MDNLEDLSNDALRLRLLEYGFANMPVTITTRNVLIKKLRNAMDASKAKTRRETVSVTKYSSEESGSETEVKKPTKATANRRATIAAASATKKEPRPIAKATFRRSGRTTPLVLSSQPVAALVEHSDEEPLLPAKQSPPQLFEKRNYSRSPSLGKSAVLTTSYVQIQAPVVEKKPVEEDEDDVIFLDDENGDSSYNDEVNEYKLSSESAFNGQWTAKPSSLSTTRTITSDNLRRLTVGGAAGGSNTARSTSPQVSSLFGNYDAVSSPLHGSTAYKRRYTTNQSTISSTTSPYYTVGAEEDDLLNKESTPYLSSFTRRLAELRADPLPGVVNRGGSPSSTSVPLSYRTSGEYYRTSSDRRSSTLAQRGYQKDSTVISGFVDFLRACERKYRLPLLILLVVLITVFIYVMLYQ